MNKPPIPSDVKRRLRHLILHLQKDVGEAEDGISRDKKEIAGLKDRLGEGFWRSAKTAVVKTVVPKRARDVAAGVALAGHAAGSVASPAVKARMMSKAKRWASGDRKEPDPDGQWNGNNSTRKPMKEDLDDILTEDVLNEDPNLYKLKVNGRHVSSHELRQWLDIEKKRRDRIRKDTKLSPDMKTERLKSIRRRIHWLDTSWRRAVQRERKRGSVRTTYHPNYVPKRSPVVSDDLAYELRLLDEQVTLIERLNGVGDFDSHPEVVQARKHIATLQAWKQRNNKPGRSKLAAHAFGLHGDTRSDHEAADDEIKKHQARIDAAKQKHNARIQHRMKAAGRYQRMLGAHEVKEADAPAGRSLTEFQMEAEDRLDEDWRHKLANWIDRPNRQRKLAALLDKRADRAATERAKARREKQTDPSKVGQFAKASRDYTRWSHHASDQDVANRYHNKDLNVAFLHGGRKRKAD